VIPDLLRTLDLPGAIVTIDAAGCHTENTRLLRDGKGHYLLTVKGNQPTLHEAVQTVFERADATGHQGIRFDHHTTTEKGHGRHEERSVAVIYEPTGLPSDWPDVAAVASVLRERVVNGAATTTVHFYLTSYAGTAEEIAEIIRGHWEIENPQPDYWRSDNLCVPGRTGCHRPGGPVRVGRVVRSTSRPRRRPMPARDPLVPPRAPRGPLFRRRSGSNSRPNSGGSCTGSSPTCSPDHS